MPLALTLGAGVLTGMIGDFLGYDKDVKLYERQGRLALQRKEALLDQTIADARYEQYQRSQNALAQEQMTKKLLTTPEGATDTLTRPLPRMQGFPKISF